MCDSSFGFVAVADVVDREAAVAPRAVAAIARDDHVVQRDALARCECGRLAAGAVHAGQPPLRHDFRLRDVLQIDDAQDVIGVAVEVRGDVGVAAARPPQPVDAEARHLEEGDLAHLARLRDVVDAQARAELLPVRDAVDQRVLEVAAQVVVRLHRDDVRAVGEEQEILGDLQVMRARVDARREEADRLELPRIRGVENRDAVAEHVADVDVPAVDHHLHAVGPAALVAVREVPDAAPDALRRDDRIGRAVRPGGRRGGRRQGQQSLHSGTARDFHTKDSTLFGRPGRTLSRLLRQA